MFIDRATREELNALSKEIFGSASRWKKFVDGVPQTVTREVEETVPAEFETRTDENGVETQVEVKAAETKKVQVPVLINPNPLNKKNPDGHVYKTIKRYTIEETRQMLLDMKVQLDNFRAQMKAQQEEQAAKQAAEKAQKDAEAAVRDAAHGSAL